jgi:arabinose-5-phosphate isomerase
MENTLAKNCIDRQIAALSRLHHVVETSEYAFVLNKVIDVAADGYKRRVLMAGVGKNANIASKISETMASLGIPTMPLNVSHLGHGDYGYIGPTDVIIHISRSGSTREMLEAIEHIKLIRPDVCQILIHCKRDKAPNPSLDGELFIGSVAEGDEFELAPTTSTTALLCTLDTIAVQASHAIGFKRFDFLKLHPDGSLGAMLKEEVRAMKQTSPSTDPSQ